MKKRITGAILAATMALVLLVSGCAKSPTEQVENDLEDLVDHVNDVVQNDDYTGDDFENDIEDFVDMSPEHRPGRARW